MNAAAAVLPFKARPSPPATWSWDAETQRYRWPKTGRAVPPARIWKVFDKRREAIKDELQGHARALAAGEIDARTFEARMRATLKQAHVQARLLGIGGKDAVQQADYGKMGAGLKKEYGFLARFASGAAEMSEAGLVNRAGYYSGSNLGNALVAGQRDSAKRAGWKKKQRLGPNDEHTCPTCRSEIAEGAVDIDRKGWFLGHQGNTECRVNDRCRIIFMK